jgi:hypothetical protein
MTDFSHMHRRWDRWFRTTQPEFEAVVRPFAGKPVTYVEIGTWAGACCEWVGRNILTHPESLGWGIDPYPKDRPRHPVEAIKQRAWDRMQFIRQKWSWIYKPSTEGLIDLHPIVGNVPGIDILFIDGDHDAHAVVQDFALAWPMLKVGSVVIFDDYRIRVPKGSPNVREGVEAVLKAWDGLVKPIGEQTRNWQFAIEVTRTRHPSRRERRLEARRAR